MSERTKLRGLANVVDLRLREKERLIGELSSKHALSERYRNNLARLERLFESAGASAVNSTTRLSVLAQNCGDYKQAVLGMADSHRDELTLHEADLKVAQQALTQAVHRHVALDRVLESKRLYLRRVQARSEQKGQDDLATQSWLRRKR